MKMLLLTLKLLITHSALANCLQTDYKPTELSNNLTDSSETIKSRNPIRFENELEFTNQNFEQPNPIVFDEPKPHPTNDEPLIPDRNRGKITFQDDKGIDPGLKKKRRRRRKPRFQRPVGAGLPGQYPGVSQPGYPGRPNPGAQNSEVQHPEQYPYSGFPFAGVQNPAVPNIGPNPGFEPNPGFGPNPGLGPNAAYRPNPGFGLNPSFEPNPGFGPNPGYGSGAVPNGQFYRPSRRPKPSFASEALSAVTGALTSIALYDDYQCVPRLLCEAAGGGSLGSSGVLQSVAGLQPLLTLLAAYNGISSSPLFVFGRAVFLGMTSKGNTATCRYAYPQCPTDTEQLVHYLNNHNGGFFRFFSNPQPQNPQNLEQFYHQLSLSGQNIPQNYGLHNSDVGQQNYGFYNPQYGLQYPNGQPNLIPQNYGLYNHELNYHGSPNPAQQYPVNPNPLQTNGYGYLQNYGPNYPYQDKYSPSKFRFKDRNSSKLNRIQKRIQNKPNYVYEDYNSENTDENSKWTFPNDIVVVKNDLNVRGGKNLKFPEETIETNIRDDIYNREAKSILFPGALSTNNVDNYKYTQNINYNNVRYQTAGTFSNNNNKFNNYYNNINSDKYLDNEEAGVRTVYIVRGNGDPNNPEIVKVRPGEKIAY